jgi:hypothetical protein
MSKLKEPKPAKLIMALLYSRREILEQLYQKLADRFGRIEWKSPEFEFTHTCYYTEEMGLNLVKMLLSFEMLVNQENLPEIKLTTNSLEQEFSSAGKRWINIDPGYLTLDRLVVATGKNSAHRIYLGNGVYADLTLVFQSGSYQPLFWTYPDYRSEKFVGIFNHLRKKLKENLPSETCVCGDKNR